LLHVPLGGLALLVALAVALHEPLSLVRGHEGDERVPAVRVARVRPPVGHVGAPQHVVLQRQAATGAVGALELRYVASDLFRRRLLRSRVVGPQLRHEDGLAIILFITAALGHNLNFYLLYDFPAALRLLLLKDLDGDGDVLRRGGRV